MDLVCVLLSYQRDCLFPGHSNLNRQPDRHTNAHTHTHRPPYILRSRDMNSTTERAQKSQDNTHPHTHTHTDTHGEGRDAEVAGRVRVVYFSSLLFLRSTLNYSWKASAWRASALSLVDGVTINFCFTFLYTQHPLSIGPREWTFRLYINSLGTLSVK